MPPGVRWVPTEAQQEKIIASIDKGRQRSYFIHINSTALQKQIDTPTRGQLGSPKLPPELQSEIGRGPTTNGEMGSDDN